eukprot:gene19854-24326_t
MPGAVPRTSTYALTNATMPYVRALANLGWKAALGADNALALGLNTVAGEPDSRDAKCARTTGIPGRRSHQSPWAKSAGGGRTRPLVSERKSATLQPITRTGHRVETVSRAPQWDCHFSGVPMITRERDPVVIEREGSPGVPLGP